MDECFLTFLQKNSARGLRKYAGWLYNYQIYKGGWI